MNPCSDLAKKAVECFIKEKKIISPPENLPKEFFQKKAGVFVTIKKNGQLRGCIGTYLPTRINIAEEIIRNAIAAATEDWRFGPLSEEELNSLTYIVYILSTPEFVLAKETSDSLDFFFKRLKEKGMDPKKYGVIVKTFPLIYPNQEINFNGQQIPKTGLLLPGLEEIKTIEEQIYIACKKGGIDLNKEKIFIYRFIVEKHQ